MLRSFLQIPIPFFRRIVLIGGSNADFGLNIRKAFFPALCCGIQLIPVKKQDNRSGRLPVSDWTEWKVRDICVYETALYCICIDLECFPHEVDLKVLVHRTTVETWLVKTAALIEEFDDLVVRTRPHTVAYFQGYYYTAAVLRSVGIKHNIRTVAFESVADASRLLWEDISGIAVNRNLAKNYYWRWRGHSTRDQLQNYADDYLRTIKNRKSHEHSSPSMRFEWNIDKPLIVYIGQVYTDSSLLYGLPNGSTPVEVIRSVVTAVREAGCAIVIKLHPKEHGGSSPTRKPYADLTWRKLQAVPEIESAIREGVCLVDFDNSIDTYSMLNQAKVVLTINSQAGLEAAIMGKPVVLIGRSFFGNADFTYDCSGVGEIGFRLGEALRECIDPERTMRAQEFFWVFQEKYCVQKNLISALNILNR